MPEALSRPACARRTGLFICKPRVDFLRERRAGPCPAVNPARDRRTSPRRRRDRPERPARAATIRAGGFCDFPAANSFALGGGSDDSRIPLETRPGESRPSRFPDLLLPLLV